MIIKFLQSPEAEQEQAGSRNPSTVPRTNSAAAAGFTDAVPTIESSHIVAAYLSEADYRLARRIVPEMRAFKDYEDWLDFRVGMFWGLGMAGFTVDLISVDLAEFGRWRRTTSTGPSISALDRFARSRGLRVSGQTKRGSFARLTRLAAKRNDRHS